MMGSSVSAAAVSPGAVSVMVQLSSSTSVYVSYS